MDFEIRTVRGFSQPLTYKQMAEFLIKEFGLGEPVEGTPPSLADRIDGIFPHLANTINGLAIGDKEKAKRLEEDSAEALIWQDLKKHLGEYLQSMEQCEEGSERIVQKFIVAFDSLNRFFARNDNIMCDGDKALVEETNAIQDVLIQFCKDRDITLPQRMGDGLPPVKASAIR